MINYSIGFSIDNDKNKKAYIYNDSDNKIVCVLDSMEELQNFIEQIAKELYYMHDFEVIYDIPF